MLNINTALKIKNCQGDNKKKSQAGEAAFYIKTEAKF